MAICPSRSRGRFHAGTLGAVTLGVVLLFPLSACRKKTQDPAPIASASPSPSEAPRTLSAEQAQKVLAKVGDRNITLGDYAAALERMDSFERLRYQSPERRRGLLNEMIELELLAQEARRRGLEKLPETEERLRQMLRDELLRDLRRELPSPNELPEAEVRKYYDEHKAEFNEPERRRISHIAMSTLGEAKTMLSRVENVSGTEWGKLVTEHSLDKGSKAIGSTPTELAGDLGIVGPPGHPRGANARVPEALRAAAFKIDKVGSVLPEVVPDAGVFHILRLSARTEPRERSFEEAERTIRITLIQERVKQREAELEQKLRAKYPVTIDEAALGKVHAPKPEPGKAAPPLRP
jgi:peptidyl-prolyl cis-trans isomerase C